MKKFKTVYDWCIERNRKDILERWDYELTKKSPNEIAKSSKDVIYSKCQNNIHQSEARTADTITKESRNNKCLCKKCAGIFDLNFENLSKYCLERNTALLDIDRRIGE